MEQQPHAVIKNLQISTEDSSLSALAAEVNAMKIAIGLISQKLDNRHRKLFLKELRQLSDVKPDELATQIEQFRV
ncbi:hypothetical protein [Pantoea piersonii]|uniref:hypothetical protein n=1 Tax=Pantoea piersonii TaxID=2364647 RepID=UPI0022F1956B|nr:hypothetical protein [Pantoea piersonii]WBV20228.1 hypothetical protein PG877_11355 [Pantoea piersonii]